MADEQRRPGDSGDAFREGVRAVTGILGAFKDAIEQTFSELSDKGEMSPDRAKDAARDAMKRAQEAVDDVRGRLDFVTRREFDALRTELAELRSQIERHASHGGHHHHAPGTAGTETTGGHGAGGSSMGDGSPGL
jgi:polyhydroxyalkanoate synthesis regulator phasin